MHQLRAGFDIHERGDGLTIAPRTGQGRHRHRIHPTIRAKGDELIDGTALEGVVKLVTCFERKAAGVVAMAAVLGSVVGARLTAMIQPETLRRGFAGFVVVMAGFVLYQQI